MGGEFRNYVSPGHAGVSDALIILPGRIIFCEIKAAGDTEKPHQERERLLMVKLGHEACCVYGIHGASMLISRLQLGYKLEGAINAPQK